MLTCDQKQIDSVAYFEHLSPENKKSNKMFKEFLIIFKEFMMISNTHKHFI